jgi:hypothetical protein
MGYRASAITEHTGVTIPQWFKDKWDVQLNIPVYEGEMFRKELIGAPRTPISYKWERKFHDDILKDLQKVVAEDTEWSGDKLMMIMMHEDGSVNRINIYADKVVIEAPASWSIEEDVHQYPGSGV